ncbi:PREDICTED: ELKS/Rab6-interacting/CAST family member 1-like [Priapulus caudatus]|uniref:ELKS/Rab6-interacting/CAST family member 1-like n=1 Tax=Priapulus caudatus TaxID=37621 RepID=A0ABM1EXB4_PRICU|nr:PREDICTED: ELKS/Rab6-interacting/CAST family member 1-like [Priapulus caudatus]
MVLTVLTVFHFLRKFNDRECCSLAIFDCLKHISTLNQLQEELRTQHRLNRHLAENVGDPGRSMAALANLDTLRTEHASQSNVLGYLQEWILCSWLNARVDPLFLVICKSGSSVLGYMQEWILCSWLNARVDPLFLVICKSGSSVLGYMQEWILCSWLHARVDPLSSVTCKCGSSVLGYMQEWIFCAWLHAKVDPLFLVICKSGSSVAPPLTAATTPLFPQDSHIRTLEREVKLLQDQVTRGRADVAAAAASSVYDLSSGVMLEGERPQPDGISMREVDELRTHERALKFRLDELRADISKRDSQLLAARTHMETLKKQQSDYQHHIVVLKESLSAKEQHTSMLQTDLETLRMKLEEKNAIIEQKTQQTLAATSERNRLAGELHELRDHMDIKERKINVLQRKIENLEDLISEKDKQLDGVKSKLSLQLDQSSDSVVASLEDAVRDKEQQIDRLKAQRERLERERMDELEAHQGALRDQRDRAEQLQAQIDEYDVQVDELKLELDSANKENIEKSTKILQLESEITQLKDRSMKLEIDLVKAQEQTLQSEQTQTNSVNEEAAHLQDRIENLEDKIGHYIGQVDKSQNEVDRLLDILKEMEEEKNEKEKQLQSLQEQVTEQTKKLGMQKREQKRSVQLLDEAKKREGDMKQNGVDMQTTLKHRNERVEELEEALRESVKITAEREVAIAEYRNKLRDVEMQLEDMRKQLEEANDAKKSKDDRLQTLRAERHRQLAELSEMKQEALRAAISEKDANIALLEMASPNPNHPRAIEDIKRLRKERDDLKKKLKEESERGMRLMSEFKEHEKQTLATPSGPAGEGKTPDGGHVC